LAFNLHKDIRVDLRLRQSGSKKLTGVLYGTRCQSIKFNDYDLIQRLVEAIRNDDSPPNIAKTLRNNILVLQERGELTKEDISNTDMITLVLEGLSYSRPRSGASSTTSTPPYDLLGQSSSSVSELSSDSLATNEDVFIDYTLPIQIQSSNSDAAHCLTEPPYSSTDFESMFALNAFDVPQTLFYCTFHLIWEVANV
jgi:hypothetical protein